MPFYVKLGPRGLIFRLGTMIIGVAGALVYRRAYRRRAAAAPASTAEPRAFAPEP